MRRPRIGSSDRVTVIGLGQFGSTLTQTLFEMGYEVTAIDTDKERIEDIASVCSLAAQGDATDEQLLRSLDVGHSDVAVVATAEQLETSIVASHLLKQLGVPWVIAKARSALHGSLLTKVGADHVILPERDSALRLAHQIGIRRVDDYISLSATTGIAKFVAPAHFAGRPVADVLRGGETPLSLLLIKRGDEVIVAPYDDERVMAQDELVVIGEDVEVERIVEATPASPR